MYSLHRGGYRIISVERILSPPSTLPGRSDREHWNVAAPWRMLLAAGGMHKMDERWIVEQIDNWVSDFLIDDAGDRVSSEIAPHAQVILSTFLRSACSIRGVTPDCLEEGDVRTGLLDGLKSISLADPLHQQVPALVGEFLADLTRRGRLADGESHQRVIEVLREEYLRMTRSEVQSIERVASKIGRNDPCPCGSGKKYKKCCINLLDSDLHS